MSFQEYLSLWPLFRDATLTGMLHGLTLGILGVYVILRRMVFLTAAVSQTASLGVVLAVFLAGGSSIAWLLSPTVGAFILTLATLTIVQAGRKSIGNTSDALLGVMYLVGAAGTMVLASSVEMELQDLNVMLFGTAVAVLREDMVASAAICAVVVFFHSLSWRGWIASTLDAEGARVRGLPVRWLDLTLFLSLALVIAQSTRVLGPLPTFAFGTLPAFAALRLSKRIEEALVFSAVFGAATGGLGYVCATMFDTSVGATQALVGVAIVIVASLLGRLRRWVAALRAASPTDTTS